VTKATDEPQLRPGIADPVSDPDDLFFDLIF
jgi:hypothetical protein